jgi:hypothetical protein
LVEKISRGIEVFDHSALNPSTQKKIIQAILDLFNLKIVELEQQRRK